MPQSIAVVGAGVSGLTAAFTAVQRGADVTVFEASEVAGGCLSRTDLGGHLPIGADDGAEASLNRRPEARGLIEELGLSPVFPSRAHGSRLITPQGPAPIPAGTLMGIPADPESLRGVLSEDGIARAREEVLTPAIEGDVSCGDFLAARLGDELVDRVLDPLIGGVYAGRCRELSLEATVPALLPAARAGTSVREAVAEVLAARTRTSGTDIPGAGHGDGTGPAGEAPPVFLSLAGGINSLVSSLIAALTARGAVLRLGTGVHAVSPGGRAPTVTTDTGVEEFDAVIIALPAWAAYDVLSADAPASDGSPTAGLTALLQQVEYATSAVLTGIVQDSGAALEGSGFLVPPSAGGLVKASTFSSNKWPWMADALPERHRVVRVSIGRKGDEAWTQQDDGTLVETAFAEWRKHTGYDGDLVHAEIRRWERALPQYRPGHARLVASIDAAGADLPGVAVTGSYLEGVGIPACIGRAQHTVARLLS